MIRLLIHKKKNAEDIDQKKKEERYNTNKKNLKRVHQNL